MTQENFLKETWNRAVQQEAVETCIAKGINFYFLTELEQEVEIKAAAKVLRDYLATQGMV
jgi:hypothetical protein